jgi:chaperonin GroES
MTKKRKTKNLTISPASPAVNPSPQARWSLKPTLKKKEDILSMAINVKPLGDRVLVQPLEEKEVKKGGIIIPDTAKEKPQEGTVVALGTGKLDESGKRIDFNVKVGDKVLISKYGGTEIKIDGDNYLIMREDDILGIIG